MRAALLALVLVQGCAGSVEVVPVPPADAGPAAKEDAGGGACFAATDPLGRSTLCCKIPCAQQLDCLSAGPHEPCQEWGCAIWGACAGLCELGPILPGQVCIEDGGLGLCTIDGSCLP